MSLIIRKAGILTTIQDLGRIGGRSFGINPNGVMDVAAARLINSIVGNSEHDAVLEMHFPAAEIEFDEDTEVAIGGADLGAQIDGSEIRNWSSSFVRTGSVMKFLGPRSGMRSYLAVAGGFNIDPWLGSSSTNLMARAGGFGGRRLTVGDRIDTRERAVKTRGLRPGSSILPRYNRFATVRVVAGSEFEFLDGDGERAFFSEGFTVTKNCDRMGYRLTGKPLSLSGGHQMVSAAVTFGTIQLLPDGQLIILMADHQTSGGYPRIGNVVSVDLPILAQCGPGDGVSFEMVTVEEAERLTLRFEKELSYLRVGCRLRNQNVND